MLRSEKSRSYGHALVAGLARPPKKVSKSFSKKKIALRSKVKPFVKLVNYNHIMPTRSVPCRPDDVMVPCRKAAHAPQLQPGRGAVQGCGEQVGHQEAGACCGSARHFDAAQAGKKSALKEIKTKFESKYLSGEGRWFYQKLRF